MGGIESDVMLDELVVEMNYCDEVVNVVFVYGNCINYYWVV